MITIILPHSLIPRLHDEANMKQTCLLHRQKRADPEIFESTSVRRF